MYVYLCLGGLVRHDFMNMEFEKVKTLVPLLEVNTTASREHVGMVEKNQVREEEGASYY